MKRLSHGAPKPGHGYIIRECLGQGRWKRVYRAVCRGEWYDRALARFINRQCREDLKNELKAIEQLRDKRFCHVATIWGAFQGDDGDTYFAEELLYRSLDVLAPIRSAQRFLRIASHLCDGLASLHEMSPPLVHRDLKLDNCGVDHLGCAKIFDLGLLTSVPTKAKGTLLTRAPECLCPDADYTVQSDIWALGAVLFALRTTDYPFVTRVQVETRPHAGAARTLYEQAIRDAAREPSAESHLRNRLVDLSLTADVQNLLFGMLEFNPQNRPSARQAANAWLDLSHRWQHQGAQKITSDAHAAALEYAAYLKAVLTGDTGMSAMQWQRTVKAVQDLTSRLGGEPVASELRDLLARVHQRRVAPASDLTQAASGPGLAAASSAD